MAGNEHLLGLGSLWDAEQLNIEQDLARERERGRKSELYFSDAIQELSTNRGLTIQLVSFSRLIHVRRIGMLWLDGVVCGSVERAIVPFGAITAAFTPSHCECASSEPERFELVPMGAVLRDLERRSAPLTILGDRYGVRGRLAGVWRDAISVRSSERDTVLPRSSLGVIIVDDDGARS